MAFCWDPNISPRTRPGEGSAHSNQHSVTANCLPWAPAPNQPCTSAPFVPASACKAGSVKAAHFTEEKTEAQKVHSWYMAQRARAPSYPRTLKLHAEALGSNNDRVTPGLGRDGSCLQSEVFHRVDGFLMLTFAKAEKDCCLLSLYLCQWA